MSVTITRVKAPEPNELCDRDSVAPAMVSVLTEYGKRFVFCGHHFDAIPELAKAKFKAINDTRP